MATHSKQKKVKGVRQKLKLFRASDPLKRVLMWGVNYSMSQLEHVKCRAMLLTDDFKAYIKVKVNNHLFNKDNMPSRFKFKEYCPLVFQNLRERFNIDKTDYWDSLTKYQPQWYSGYKFLVSYNRHYMIKSITSEEVEQMHHMLQEYHEYIVNRDGDTLLPQYLGMYRVTVNDQETYMLAMRYAFSPRMSIHRKYDLKGSTVDREASEKEKKNNVLPTLKDVDFVNDACKILIGEKQKLSLLDTLEVDVQFLQKNNLMDYSLIVGIHDPDLQLTDEEVAALYSPEEDEDANSDCEHDLPADFSPDCLTPPDSPPLFETGHLSFHDELSPDLEFYGIKSSPKSERQLVYFLALTDILTHYGMRKRTAKTYKAVVLGPGADISTIKPDAYAKRFLEFITQSIE